MKKRLKGQVTLLLALVFLLVVAGCGGQNTGNASSDGDVVKIGVIVAETGPASTLGSSQANTVKVLQKQLDEAGPVDGK